jgi:hypothetical protein
MEISTEIIKNIADSLEAGEKCFINKKNLEVITYPEMIYLFLNLMMT